MIHLGVMKLLPFLAVMALFLQWKYASPYLPSPTLKRETVFARNMPLALFVMSGVIMSVAMWVPDGHGVLVMFMLFGACLLMVSAVAIAFL